MARVQVKWVLATLVLLLGGWALVPPEEGRDAAAASDDADSAGRSPVKHVLTVYPGFYVPGTVPPGHTEPLRGMAEVARDFERLYPDTRIEFVNVPSSQREWLVTQLAGGQAPDILSVEVEDVWVDTQKGWYAPLDAYLARPNPFVAAGQPGAERWWDLFKYQTVTRGKLGPDGRMWCIPLDMVETGIFYNKTIFDELGLALPRTWEEFLDVQERLAQAGYLPMAVDPRMLADWAVDLLFDQLYRPIAGEINLRTSEAQGAYLANYLDTGELALLRDKGFFTEDDPRYVELWRLMLEWRQYMPRDLSVTIGATDAPRLFLSGRTGMYWSSSVTTDALVSDPELSFEWDVFYLPPITRQSSPFAAEGGHEMCVIGGAATQLTLTNRSFSDTGDPATSQRLERCVAFLQFLTAPRNAERVINETSFFLPNIVGVEPLEPLKPFDEILKRPYTMTKWAYTFDLRFSEVQKRLVDLLLNDPLMTPERMAAEMSQWIKLSAATAARRQDLGREELEALWETRHADEDEAE